MEHAQDMLAVTDSIGLAQFHVLAHGMGTGLAPLLALRDLLQLGDGYCWRHDPRLVLPDRALVDPLLRILTRHEGGVLQRLVNE